ncbi:hypothetical protein Tco_0008376 [Tanacetum coccineum]
MVSAMRYKDDMIKVSDGLCLCCQGRSRDWTRSSSRLTHWMHATQSEYCGCVEVQWKQFGLGSSVEDLGSDAGELKLVNLPMESELSD